MAADDLTSPGGFWQVWRKRLRRVTVLGSLLVLTGAFALFVAGWLIFVDDPHGGEPVVVVALDHPTAIQADSGDDLGIRPTVDSREAAPLPSGHSQPPADIVISDPLAAPSNYTGPRSPGAQSSGPASGGTVVASLDTSLLESGPYGPLPVIDRDGRRAAEVYSAATGTISEEQPRIAILIGGMGLSITATEAAIDRLPREVTLAFAPYGDETDRLTSRARQSGHELALQVPLEPYDYPDNDPGPHTLLTGLSVDQNRDRLHWVMSRFTGYVGIVNYMGARFTASDQSLRPILGELRDRGLIYVDDGSSSRSVAGHIASEVGLPFAKADIVVDAVPARADIDAQLARLEDIARQKGVAVGVASGLPIAIDAIDAWADGLQGKGIVLIPASAAASGGET
ncbi:divergent polysaccharide deacetylase family protein [Microbaculum sp. FT89]|uniref:divergent polysaccharide deacetylase family protein n=1 Tax=Microbaculum sp. FT89 TaxID=3447298 RepID=UPI003F53B16C